MTTKEDLARLQHFDPSHLCRQYRGFTASECHRTETEMISRVELRYLSKRPSRRQAPFSYVWMLAIHKKMFGRLWDYGGKIRTQKLNIGVDHTQIRSSLNDLVDNIKTWQQFQHDEIEQVARLHSEAVRIHPFMNGNGRWARLLADIYSYRHFEWVTEWPNSIGQTRSSLRDEYLEAIKSSIEDGDLDRLKSLHQRFQSSRNRTRKALSL